MTRSHNALLQAVLILRNSLKSLLRCSAQSMVVCSPGPTRMPYATTHSQYEEEALSMGQHVRTRDKVDVALKDKLLFESQPHHTLICTHTHT